MNHHRSGFARLLELFATLARVSTFASLAVSSPGLAISIWSALSLTVNLSLSSAASRALLLSLTVSWSSALSPRPRPPPVSSSLRALSRTSPPVTSWLLALVPSTVTASVSPWVLPLATRFWFLRYVDSQLQAASHLCDRFVCLRHRLQSSY